MNKVAAKHYVPMLNIRSEDYRLRTELAHCLSKQNITSEMLTFRDQMDLHDLNHNCQVSVTLVDHNVLPESDKVLEANVVEVIDHRKVERRKSNR